MMAKYEIDIEGVPEGYEPVRYDVPKSGETFVTQYGNTETAINDCDWCYPRLIVRKKQTVRPWTFETAPHSVKVKRKSDGGFELLELGECNGKWGFYANASGNIYWFEKAIELFKQLDGSPCGEVVQ